jgi:esterase/lipase superfamily enzyme
MELYQRGKAILCVGQGPWEVPETTFALRDILQQKGIPAWVDIWGYDCAHDWDWWYKQVTYFVPHLLD